MTKKARIIQAAVALIAEQGVHATPMSAIAKAAQTGMGTIYNYFPNKEQLINAIYQQIKEEEQALLTPFLNTAAIRTQFEVYYAKIVNFYLEFPAYFSFMEQLHASPIITEESREVGRASVACVYALIETGQQQRILKEIPVATLMQFTGGSIFSFVRTQKNNTPKQIQEALKLQLQMTWDGIRQ